MQLYALLIGSLLLLLQGCTTSTKPVVNSIPSAAVISPTLQQPPQKALKRKVAIARFSNETRHNSGLLLNENNDRVGKQAMDILSTRLTQTGQFLMLERADLDKISAEKKFAGLITKNIGADYLIVGSVSEFGRSTSSEVGVFSRNKIQTAKATVNVRLVDVKTGQIIFAQEGSGNATTEANTVLGVGTRAGYDAALDDQALSAAISKLVSNLSENLLNQPWQAYLIGESQGYFVMTGGPSQGIKVGDRFLVQKQGAQVQNPQTGMMIQLPGTQVATIEVATLSGQGNDEVALCRVVSGSLTKGILNQLIVRELKP